MNKAVFSWGGLVLFQVGRRLYRVQDGRHDRLRKDRLGFDDAMARLTRCMGYRGLGDQESGVEVAKRRAQLMLRGGVEPAPVVPVGDPVPFVCPDLGPF